MDGNIRSGQTIMHPQGDVTIIGRVASGAEIVAGGSVHIYGALQGRVIAGISGSRSARIFCTEARAELLCIGGAYVTAENTNSEMEGRGSRGAAGRRRTQTPNLKLKGTQGDNAHEQGDCRYIRKGWCRQNHLDRLAWASRSRRAEGASASSISTSDLRNLDLVMGAERRVVFDFINVAQGDAKLSQALIRDKRIDTLHLLAASQTRDKDALTTEGVERVIGELRETFDYVLCDSPAGIERGALLAMRHADQAIVVANPEVSSVRDSDRIIGLLDFEDPARRARRADGEAPAAHAL